MAEYKNNLKRILADEGITQAELCAVSGLSTATVNGMVNGRAQGNRVTRGKVIRALKELTEPGYTYEEVFSANDGSELSRA